jgi:(2Fe-2S) ferredoxin
VLYQAVDHKKPLLLVYNSGTHVYGLEKPVIRRDVIAEHMRFGRMSDEKARGFEFHESRSLIVGLRRSK